MSQTGQQNLVDDLRNNPLFTTEEQVEVEERGTGGFVEARENKV